MNEPLNKNIVLEITDAYNKYSKLEECISNRTNYVIRKIAEIFDNKVEWWNWSNGGGEIDGHFEVDLLQNEEFRIAGSFKKHHDMVAILNNGDEWGFEYFSFPTRFLFEKFEDELIAGSKNIKNGKQR